MESRTVRVWLLNGTLENIFEMHTYGQVWALVALPENEHALSSSHDGTIKLFNVDDGTVLRTFTHHTDPVTYLYTNFVYCLALLPDVRRFVSGSYDKTARITELI